MSTTTTTAPVLTGVYTADAPVLATEVQALMVQGATEKQAFAVACRDNELTNAAGGEAMASVFGQPVKPGGFGNLVTAGLRAVGRDAEIATGNSGGGNKGAVKVRGLKALIAAEREKIARERVRVDALVAEARKAVEAFDPDAEVEARIADLTEQAKAIAAEAKALKADPSPFTEARKAEVQAALDAAEARYTEAIAALDAAEAELTGAA